MPDELLESLGEFYTSEYVAANQPWIRKIPFEEYVNRLLAARGLTTWTQ